MPEQEASAALRRPQEDQGIMRDERDPATSTPSVSWMSPSYGFGTDLAYYQQVFREFNWHFPDTTIYVETGFPVDLYPDLPLKPAFSYYTFEDFRTVDDVVYQNDLRLPTPRTAWTIFRDRSDVVIVIEFTPVAICGWIASKLRRRPVLLLIESDPAFRGGSTARLSILVKRLIASTSSAVMVSNRHGLRYVRETLKLPERKIVVGPYITSDPLQSSDQVPHSMEDGPVKLLFLNSLSPRKGIVELLKALAMVPPELSSAWTLSIVGSGELEDVVRDLVATSGLSDRVSFHGQVAHERTPEFYAAAHIVVCPTLADYRSLAGIEAVNAGRAVIVSDKDGATDEILRYAATAWVINPNDIEGFARTLTSIFADRARLKAQIDAAASVPPEFSLASVGDNLKRAVFRALGSAG